MEQYPPSPKRHPLTALAFLEIGLFEFFFVIITLLLIFGTLNYFNILPVSDVFPKYLSWLPRQQAQTKTAPLNYTPVSSPTPQGQFQYDTKKAETLLTQYIKENIKQEFIPNKIEVKQGQQIDGNPGRIQNEFGSKFTSPTASFFVNFHFIDNTNDPKDFTIFIQPNNVNETILTTSLANSLISSYFNNTDTTSSCTTKETISICNVLETNANERKEFGAFFGKDKGNITPIVFTCSIFKGSKEYNTYKSCINF